MTEAFENFRDDFNGLVSETWNLIRQLQSAPGMDRPRLQEEIDRKMMDADRYLKLMDAESKGSAGQLRREMTQGYQECRNKLSQTQNEVRRIQVVGTQEQREQRAQQITNMSNRDRLVEYNSRNNQAGNVLEGVERRLADTQGIAQNTAEELNRQGDTLRRANEQVIDVKEEATDAGGVIRKLQMRVFCNSVILYIIIALLIVAIIVVVLKKVGVF